jgi:hypothetical protein
MANWAYVENNTVVGVYDFLPKNWKNVSGLRNSESNIQFLKSLGWYTITKQHEDYDTSKYQIDNYFYEFIDKSVVEKLKLIERSETPFKENLELSFEEQKQIFMNELREKRNELLKESDFTQLADIQQLLNDEKKEEWIIYRQKLRDIPQENENNEIVSINEIVPPTLPKI